MAETGLTDQVSGKVHMFEERAIGVQGLESFHGYGRNEIPAEVGSLRETFSGHIEHRQGSQSAAERERDRDRNAVRCEKMGYSV